MPHALGIYVQAYSSAGRHPLTAEAEPELVTVFDYLPLAEKPKLGVGGWGISRIHFAPLIVEAIEESLLGFMLLA